MDYLNMHATTGFSRMKVFINTGLANLNSEKELSFYKKKNSYSQNERDCLLTGES